MKLGYLFMIAIALSTLSACGQKPTETTEKVMDKVNDALDRRPNEKAHDAVEDITSAVKDASEEAQGKMEEIAKEIKNKTEDAVK
ncbi:MAG: hypothetical protein KBF68_10905 [Nitrosomonas sp.]|jgi:hypothetical protein|nr:hypothetical protein [Nitrosomonas sp.]MBP9101853.1 hypothetical protein [Nitrosomonas sp.]